MDTPRTRTNRLRARTIYYSSCFVVGILASLIGISQSASAAMILNTIRYDGSVRDNGNTGIEKHFRSFLPAGVGTPSGIQALPAVAPIPAPPLAPTKDIQLFQFLQTTGGLGTTPYVEVWIRASLGPVFANPLDTTLGMPPIELELELYQTNVDPGDKLFFPHIGVDGGLSITPPYPAPAGGVMVSNNRGTMDDPLTVLIKLNANEANLTNQRGEVKVRLYFDTMLIPEPASLALVGLGCVGMLGLARRRRT